VQKISNKQVVLTYNVTWAIKYLVRKIIVHFNPVTRDLSMEEVEVEPLLNPDAHMIPEDDPVIIPNKNCNNESIIGMLPPQNQNPVAAAVPNQNPRVPTAVVNPNMTISPNSMTGVVQQNVGGTAYTGMVRKGAINTVDKQLRRLQIDMTDIPKKTVPDVVLNDSCTGIIQVAAAVCNNDERLCTELHGKRECLFIVSMNSGTGNSSLTAEAMRSPEGEQW
jgi:hypothetical protein